MSHMALASARGGPELSVSEISSRIERIPFSGWHVKMRVLLGAATLFDGFDALAIAQVLPVLVPLWKLSSPQVGALISVGYLGQLFGALFFGWLAERWGRLNAVTAAIALFALMSVLCALAWDYNSFFVFRTIQGFGLGGEVPVAATYISEISKAQGRGRFVLLYEGIFTVGIVAAGFVGSAVVPTLGWQYMFYIGAAPIVIALVLRSMLPESPRWLVSRARYSEAEAAISEIERAAQKSLGYELPAAKTPDAILEKQASWRDIFGPIYLKRTLVVWTIWFSCYLVYYSLVTWLPTLYRTLFNVPLADALHYGLMLTACSLAGIVTCALVIDTIGRKLLFILSLGGSGLCLVVLGIRGVTSVSELLIIACAIGFLVGASTVGVYVYTTELYPTRSRAMATALGSAWLRLASMIGPYAVGLTISSGIETTILVFAAVALIASAIVAIWGTETTNRRLEEVSP